jgi:hypothetical protein
LTELVFIRDNTKPEKVFDEGDSLEMDVDIHRVYWAWDLYKPNDYEPVAVAKDKKFCLTRLHNKGIVLWLNSLIKNGKPVVQFSGRFHTPRMCSNEALHTQKTPVGLDDIAALYYFKKRYSQFAKQALATYNFVGYDTLIEGQVPDENQFLWKGIEYCDIIGSGNNLDLSRKNCEPNYCSYNNVEAAMV